MQWPLWRSGTKTTVGALRLRQALNARFLKNITAVKKEDMSSQDLPCLAAGFSTRSDVERAQVDQKLSLGPGMRQPASLENIHDVLLVF